MGLKEGFERRGFAFFEFQNREDAVLFVCERCAGKTVSFGGSVTLQELDLYNRLQDRSTCFWHWKQDSEADIRDAEVFITSANAISQDGQIVNIDGNCNRVAGSLYGHKHVIFIVGKNKLCSDLPSAWDRARNVAAPKNAKRLGRQTPCAVDGICHDCQSPQCICSVISVLRKRPSSCDATIIFIQENLGY